MCVSISYTYNQIIMYVWGKTIDIGAAIGNMMSTSYITWNFAADANITQCEMKAVSSPPTTCLQLDIFWFGYVIFGIVKWLIL